MIDLADLPLASLEIDLDCRIADLWREIGPVEDVDLELFGPFMRAAYWRGYEAALCDGGELCTVHGYRKPRRR